MHFELTREILGVDAEQAVAWWLDFQEGRHDHGFLPGAQRSIVRRDGERVTMRDETRVASLVIFRETTTAWPTGNGVSFEGANGLADFAGHYGFETMPGGTLVRLSADVHLRPAVGWAPFLARPVITAILEADLRGHANELRADLPAR